MAPIPVADALLARRLDAGSVAAASLLARGSSSAATTANGTIDWSIYTHGLNGVDNRENGWLSHSLFFSVCLMLLLLTILRLQHIVFAKIRRVLFLHGNTLHAQLYWATPASRIVNFIKKHILWAPIGKVKHNKEIKLSEVINFGTLPTRLQTLLLLIYFGSNVVYCTILLDWTLPKPQLVAEFRGRCGVMAVVNMVPLFVLAGRNNPLISLLGISFDTWNLIHRWMGRVVAFESICHVTAWTINKVDLAGWSGVWEMLRTSPFILNGFIAAMAFFIILFHSPSPIRHAAYETFLHAHITLAFVALITLFYHLKIDALPQVVYVFVIMGIWGYDRLTRLLRILYRNCGMRPTRFRIVALPGGEGACRVDVAMARPWKYTPGTHAYVYLPRVSLWQSHPFSVAWSSAPQDGFEGPSEKEGKISRDSCSTEDTKDMPRGHTTTKPESSKKRESEATISSEGGPKSRAIGSQNPRCIVHPPATPEPGQQPVNIFSCNRSNVLSMLVSKRYGMTKTLWNMANQSPDRTIYLTGFLEGQYGGYHKLNSYGMVVLIAGGVGITHCIGLVRELLRQRKEGTCVASKVVLIWVIPDKQQYEWCRQWFDEIFVVPGWDELISVEVYVSRVEDIASDALCEHACAHAGRPEWDSLFGEFAGARLGTIGVTVCGPGALSDSIRLAVRKQIHKASIDFIEESFTW